MLGGACFWVWVYVARQTMGKEKFTPHKIWDCLLGGEAGEKRGGGAN